VRNKSQQKVLSEIGNVIANQRITKGMSRNKLALELNTDEKQIRRIEKGEVNPTILTLLKIFTILEIDLSILSDLKIEKSFFYE